jgi:FMN phosphatase YigB (HAD superfamily)
MIKALVFDCFGVIITDGLTRIISDMCASDPDKAHRLNALVEAADRGDMSFESMKLAIGADLGVSPSLFDEMMAISHVKDASILSRIKELGETYQLAILSNVHKNGLIYYLDQADLEPFDVQVASGDVGYAKPDTRIFEVTVQKLGVQPSECVMIDDRQDNCDAAVQIGMHAIRYQTLPQLNRDLQNLDL